MVTKSLSDHVSASEESPIFRGTRVAHHPDTLLFSFVLFCNKEGYIGREGTSVEDGRHDGASHPF